MFFDHYPYTNFHNVNLDWVLQAVKAWGQTVEANDRAFQDLKEANEDFKAYVTNYLQDLDITDEINTKLDAMLASGVLTPYFAPYVQGYVNSWLNSHVIPTSPALDNTLTLSGAAARADAVGHRLKDLAYIDALSTPEVVAALNRSQVLPGYRVQGITYDYDGHYYVCGGSVDEDGTGVIVKMTKPDFSDAEISVIPQLGHANDITYYDGYLYVCTVGGGNAPQWGIYKINVNDFTDKTLISNAPENTISIAYRQGDFWLLAPYRIYRTTDFTSYEVIVDNTNNLMTAYGIPTSGRISQTIFRAAGYLIGWVCSFVFEERHYGALTFFSSTGQPVAFKMFPAYHSELQGAVYADMSIWLLSDGNLVNVFRMDPRNLSYIQLKAGDDLNDFTGRGTLYSTGSNVSSELVNSPSAGEGFTVQVERLGVYNTIQTARTNSGRELYRVKSFSAGTWGEWIEPAAEVGQIKSEVGQIKADLGDKSHLETLDKTNIVSAINSLNGVVRIIANRDTSWAGIRENVKSGYGEILYPVGTDFSVSCPSGAPYNNIVFTVVNHRVENDEPIMTLLMKHVIYGIQFDAIQAMICPSEPMPAGTYHFKLLDGYDTANDGGKYVQFALANALEAGGQIVIDWPYNQTWIGKKATVYHAFGTAAVETCVMSEGTGGTYLGVADGTVSILNHTHRGRYGSNNYAESAVREWLDSDGAAGAWQTQKTKFQRPCSYNASNAGFVTYLDPEFVAIVRSGSHPNRTNQVFDLNGTEQAYSTTDKFYLLSNEEVGFTSESGIVCGTVLDFYKEAAQEDKIKYDITSQATARYWWLRLPYPSTAHIERYVYSSGTLNSVNANSGIGAAAACEI